LECGLSMFTKQHFVALAKLIKESDANSKYELAQDSIGSFVSSVPEKLDLSDLTECESRGFSREAVMHSVYQIVAPEFGLKVEWCGKESYDKKRRNEERKTPDFIFRDKHGAIFSAHEEKNYKNPKKQYGLDVAQKEVTTKLEPIKAKHKVLSISNFNTFQYQAREHLQSQGFEVFSNNKLLGYTDFKGKKFHKLIMQVRNFIKGLIAKDKAYEKFKQEENKKLTEWFNNQQTNNQTSSLASFILSNLSLINYNTILLNNKKIVDRPTRMEN